MLRSRGRGPLAAPPDARTVGREPDGRGAAYLGATAPLGLDSSARSRHSSSMELSEAPHRPWAVGIGLILVGLVVATVSNVTGLSAPGGGAPVRAAGGLGYAAGIVICGAGLHRLIWFRPTPRPRWLRVLVTAVVTPPVFAISGVVVGTLMTLLQARLRP